MASKKAEKGIVKIRGFLFLCKNQGKSHWKDNIAVIIPKEVRGQTMQGMGEEWDRGREDMSKRLWGSCVLSMFAKQQGGQCDFYHTVSKDQRGRKGKVGVLVWEG